MNMSVRDKGEKTMGGGFWGGLTEGIGESIQKSRDRQADAQMKNMDNAQAQAKMILQGLIEGNIRPAGEGETPTLNAPGMTMPATGLKNRLKAAFGLPTEQQTMPGQGYVAQSSKKWEPASREEALDFERAKNTKPESPILKKQKIKDRTDLSNTVTKNKLTKQYVNEALEAVDKIPHGQIGKIKRFSMKQFDPNNPILGEWQKIKSVLSDLQLGKLQLTKGAVSDAEMKFFKTAVANDDISSAPQIKLILSRALGEMDAEEEGKRRTYVANYEEDPDEFLGGGIQLQTQQEQGDVLTKEQAIAELKKRGKM